MTSSIPASVLKYHKKQAEEARRIYIASRTPGADRKDWAKALEAARDQISALLRASENLQDIPAALRASGSHTLVLRHLLAPPISQDQFSLRCPAWNKNTEKNGSALSKAEAAAVAREFKKRRSQTLTNWLDLGRRPTLGELRQLLSAVAPLIGSQQVQTLQRNQAAAKQENAVIDLLKSDGWIQVPAKRIDSRGELLPKQFSYKTKFATKGRKAKEVDLAIGLPDTVALAMECKVTNDGTNSIKRVDDVLRKAGAWKDQWGNFVKTAALLQGVIGVTHVEDLLAHQVEVFWSHDLSRFQKWLRAQMRVAAPPGKPGKTHRPPRKVATKNATTVARRALKTANEAARRN